MAGQDGFDRQAHWQRVFMTKEADALSWYQSFPEISLRLIARAGAGPSSRLIDVGGGDSLLVDTLLSKGFADVTVLDISPAALERARQRLGEKGHKVRWIEADITAWTPEETWDVWHDRAVFHFLTAPEDRAAYRERLNAALKPGGQAILATFAADGPEKCSGLPVVRYEPLTLAAELGPGLKLAETQRQVHTTPSGKAQNFLYCRFERVA
jgi:SAM-dependent methyltransferase